MADANNSSNEEGRSLPSTAHPTTTSTATATETAKPDAEVDDSDPDFDDLDDVLDQFSANAPAPSSSSTTTQAPSQTTPSASGPGRPSSLTSAPLSTGHNDPTQPAGQQSGESESDFMDRLSKEMSTMLGTLSIDPSQSTQSPEEIAKMGKELEEFTYRMEKEGIQPEDLLKALLGDEEATKITRLAQTETENMTKEARPRPSPLVSTAQPSPTTTSTTATATTTQHGSFSPPVSPSSSSSSKPQPKSFEDTIRSTMSRLGESDKSATTAAQQSSSQKNEQDLLAEMLRTLDAGPTGGAGGNADDGLSKMFMDMMQQLTHRDLLYEPMKELNDQYPTWLAANRSKLPPAEFERYSRQSTIVAEITRKFEEPNFSDDDPGCKEFVWERMQRMQDEGAPPEDLVKNPFPGTDFGGIPGLGGGGGGGGGDGDNLPEGLSKELEEGCPTQ